MYLARARTADDTVLVARVARLDHEIELGVVRTPIGPS